MTLASQLSLLSDCR